MEKKIKLLIAAHKEFVSPNDEVYLPVHVGAEGRVELGYQRDDEGENISSLNPYFCELTGVYWAWKNLDAEYIGLDHYRRYFGQSIRYKEGMDINDYVLSQKEIEGYLKEADIIVPKKRNYYIETLYNHYANTLDGSHLDKARVVIGKTRPEYLDSFDKVMKQRGGHMFNMFIMKKEYLDEYCSWLFPILFELKNQIDVKDLTPFEARLFGRVSELLFNVWLDKTGYKVKEVSYFDAFEVNWIKKGTVFLQAKFFKKKYKESF